MYTVSDNTPSAGCIQWSGLHMQYNGTSYTIADGYTNYMYVYWSHTTPTQLVVSNTLPTNLTDDDCLVFLNKGGIHLTIPNTTLLDGDLLVPGTVMAGALAANSVSATNLQAGSVTANAIAAGSITANAIAANAIGASAIAAGVITGDKLVSATITGDKIAASTITVNNIAANTITAAKIASGTITAAQIASNTITASQIAAGTITGDKIAAGTITADRIQGGTMTLSQTLTIVDNSQTNYNCKTSFGSGGVTLTKHNIPNNLDVSASYYIDASANFHIDSSGLVLNNGSGSLSCGGISCGSITPSNVSFYSYGTNQISNGTGDGASWTTYNLKIASWYGVSFYNNSSGGLATQSTIIFDVRTGNMFSHGRMCAENGYNYVGKFSGCSWNGSISSGSSVTITHNLGYNPIVSIGGTLGNIQLTYSYPNYNQVTVYNWSSGANGWTGYVYMW